jgi:hypothetical protein
MSIRKLQAEAAIKALIASNAAEMFDKIRGNQHSMNSSFSNGLRTRQDGYFKEPRGVIFRRQARPAK